MSAATQNAAPTTSTTPRRQFRVNLQTYALIFAVVIIWALFAFVTSGAYLGPQNISNLFRQMTVTSFLAIGMVLVIVTGNIDLSVGRLAGFVSVVVAFLQARIWPQYLPGQELLTTALSVLIGLGVGILIEAIQGYLIAFRGVPSFVVTLGGLNVLNGAILLVTEGKTIPANQPMIAVIAQGYLPPIVGWVIAAAIVAFLFFSMFTGRQRKVKFGFQNSPLYLDVAKTAGFSALIVLYVFIVNRYNGVQIPVLLLALTSVVIHYLANNTRFGRYAYAIGGNREAARLSGVNIKRNVFTIFLLMGLLCGIGGVVLASYVGYGTIAAGTGYELDAIAAAILGGTSTLGGEGTIFGALVGGLIVASLGTGLQMMNVAPAWQYVVKGTVLVLAVLVDVTLKRRR